MTEKHQVSRQCLCGGKRPVISARLCCQVSFLSSEARAIRFALALDLGYPLGGGQAGLPDSQRDMGREWGYQDLPAWDSPGASQRKG